MPASVVKSIDALRAGAKVPVLAEEMSLFPRFKVPALHRPPAAHKAAFGLEPNRESRTEAKLRWA
jgi:hypothetical protein